MRVLSGVSIGVGEATSIEREREGQEHNRNPVQQGVKSRGSGMKRRFEGVYKTMSYQYTLMATE